MLRQTHPLGASVGGALALLISLQIKNILYNQSNVQVGCV